MRCEKTTYKRIKDIRRRAHEVWLKKHVWLYFYWCPEHKGYHLTKRAKGHRKALANAS